MSERDDLDNLLKSPGWQTLVETEREWWRINMSAQVRRCADSPDDTAALNKLRQICAAQDAVERFIKKPMERLKQLTADVRDEREREEAPVLSRRGGL